MAETLLDKLAQSHPSLARGQVWCRTCGSTRKVDSAEAMRSGWPLCCGFTMTIDAPTSTGDVHSYDYHTLVGVYASLEGAKLAAESHAASTGLSFGDPDGWDNELGWDSKVALRYLYAGHDGDYYAVHRFEVDSEPGTPKEP